MNSLETIRIVIDELEKQEIKYLLPYPSGSADCRLGCDLPNVLSRRASKSVAAPLVSKVEQLIH